MRFGPFCIALMLVLLVCLIGGALGWVAKGYASDQFVQMLEARMQVSPGATKVVPECGCTIRYLGTAVHGRRYTIQLDRLD